MDLHKLGVPNGNGNRKLGLRDWGLRVEGTYLPPTLKDQLEKNM